MGKIETDQIKRVKIPSSIRIENGKAVVELFLDALLDSDVERDGRSDGVPWRKEGRWQVYLKDARGLPAFYGAHPMREEDPCVIQLLHPHLWEGVSNPYRYQMEIYEVPDAGEEAAVKKVCGGAFPVRDLTVVPGKGLFLNGRPFEMRAVRYEFLRESLRETLPEALVKMGANTVLFYDNAIPCRREFDIWEALCDRCGLLPVLIKEPEKADTEYFGNAAAGMRELFTPEGLETEKYYSYKARWSREPFVYICPDSLQRNADGLMQVKVYSNQKKTALFVGGVLFSVQTDGPEFVFRDFPVKGVPFFLTAEAGECSMSVTFYRR